MSPMTPPNVSRASVVLRLEFPGAAQCLVGALEPLHAGELLVATEVALPPGTRLRLGVVHPGAAPLLEWPVEVVAQEGEVLRVRLPLQDEAACASLRARILEQGGVARVPPFRVLLVEDNPHIVQMYSRALRRVFPEERAAVEVERVANGQEALQRLAGAPPVDLVVTDLYMPVVDGFQLAEKMRSEPGMRHVPVVLISAAGLDAEDKARRLGIQAFLHKPVQLNMIVDCVRKLMDGRG